MNLNKVNFDKMRNSYDRNNRYFSSMPKKENKKVNNIDSEFQRILSDLLNKK